MWLGSRSARGAQDALHIARTNNELTRTGSMTACALASIAACALVFSAAAQNVAYAYGLGLSKGEFAAYVLAAASLGASILGPCAWAAVFGRGVGFGRRCVALVMAAGCLAYASTCSLGFVSTSRDAAIAERTAATQSAKVRADLARSAQNELNALKGQRLDIIERRAELTALLEKLAAAPISERTADSQSAALAYYIRTAGYAVTDEAVGTWLNLAMVLFLELAAALSVTVASALYPSTQPVRQIRPVAADLPAPTQVPPAPKTAAHAPASRGNDDKDGDTPPPAQKAPRKAGRPRSVSSKDVLHRISAAGGSVSGSLATIGTVIGAKSKATTHSVLHQLAQAGQVTLETGRGGCRVALV